MQLELGFWPKGSVRSVLTQYMAMRGESVTIETMEADYRVRLEWLCEVFGPATPAAEVTFVVLERVAKLARLRLADTTIRKRFEFFCAAVEYAVDREEVSFPPAKIPPWLQRHGRQMDDFYTPAQFGQFRLALPAEKIRDFSDLGMWTGQHTLDLETMERWMLEPGYQWPDTERVGRWWRRNHKNKKCTPCWIPMEPELVELAGAWLAEPRSPGDRICGVVWNKGRHFERAAERTELHRIRANLGLRSSHATELLARGYSYEYVRLVLGHRGEMRSVDRAPMPGGPPVPARPVTTRPTTLSAHYLRPSPNTLRPR